MKTSTELTSGVKELEPSGKVFRVHSPSSLSSCTGGFPFTLAQLIVNYHMVTFVILSVSLASTFLNLPAKTQYLPLKLSYETAPGSGFSQAQTIVGPVYRLQCGYAMLV